MREREQERVIEVAHQVHRLRSLVETTAAAIGMCEGGDTHGFYIEVVDKGGSKVAVYVPSSPKVVDVLTSIFRDVRNGAIDELHELKMPSQSGGD